MKTVMSIIGARPQFVKAALICKRLEKDNIRNILVHTGQHYDFNMSDIFFQELSLPKPDYFLGIGSYDHGMQTGKMLIDIENVVLQERPDWVIVYGDTNTTLAGALAASKLHIPIAHVEAGLRSHNKAMPEEINRILADHVSSVLLCPSKTAINNLRREGFNNIHNNGELMGFDDSFDVNKPYVYASPMDPSYSPSLVVNVGDIMFDQVLLTRKMVSDDITLKKYNLNAGSYILVTIHRPENTDIKENLEGIITALEHFAHNGITVLFPAHPRTLKALAKFGLNQKQSVQSMICEPVSYTEMISLESNARLIFTDSGGVQKESYFLHTPCVIPRNEVEWVELVDLGWTTLTGKTSNAIIESIEKRLSDKKGNEPVNVYGDGHAGDRIGNLLKELL